MNTAQERYEEAKQNLAWAKASFTAVDGVCGAAIGLSDELDRALATAKAAAMRAVEEAHRTNQYAAYEAGTEAAARIKEQIKLLEERLEELREELAGLSDRYR